MSHSHKKKEKSMNPESLNDQKENRVNTESCHKQESGRRDDKPVDDAEDIGYYEGFYYFRNQTLEVLMDEETYEKYRHAYLVRHSIETRSDDELMDYVTMVEEQHAQARNVLFNPEYWREIRDRKVWVIPRRDILSEQAPAQVTERKPESV
jgi:hypothetical protein